MRGYGAGLEGRTWTGGGGILSAPVKLEIRYSQ